MASGTARLFQKQFEQRVFLCVKHRTQARSRHQFEFEGPINVVGKGKGNIEVYKLIHLASHLRDVTV